VGEESGKNRLLRYADMLRSYMNSDEMLIGMFLAAKTKKEYEKIPNKVNENSTYETMLTLADSLGVRNPFPDAKHFFDVYVAIENEIDWEVIIAMGSRRSGTFYIPEIIIAEFNKHFKKETRTVLIAEGEKFAPNLKKIVDEHEECHYVVTSEKPLLVEVLKEIFSGYENVEVLNTSIYKYEFLSEKFDLILSVPSFGGRALADESQMFMCREYELIATENLLLHLNREGELVTILPARITFAAGRVKDLREFIQQMYKLEEISELPGGIFASTGIKTYLFSISGGRTDDITIRRYSNKGNSQKVMDMKFLALEEETFVMASELEEFGDWSLDKIFAMQDEDWQRYLNSGIKKVELGIAAEVFRGKAINRKDENGSIGVVNISNLREYDIDYDNLDHLGEEERKVANYILQDGDLLLPARGTAIRTAVFKKQYYQCIPSSNIIVIRPNEKMLLGTYLKVFLDSPLGEKVISGAQQGTVVMNISYKDLKSLEIPLPPIDKQKKIADEYEHELKVYQESIKAAENRWNEVVGRLQSEI